jgi:hypothetical protein
MIPVDLNLLREKMIKAGLSDGHFKMMGLEPPEYRWIDMSSIADSYSKYGDKNNKIYITFKETCEHYDLTKGRVIVYPLDGGAIVYEDTGAMVPSEVTSVISSYNLKMRIPRDFKG